MLVPNPYKGSRELEKPDVDPYEYHKTLPFVKETPLHNHVPYARRFGVKNVYVKEEGLRIELKSFKILGVSYALHRYLEKRLGPSGEVDKTTHFCAATDGNHGRAMSYMTQRLGCPCTIYVPFDTSEGRMAEIRRYDADVIQTDVNYDATMVICDKAAQDHNWVNISDTAYGDHDVEVPTYIMQGYSSIFREALLQVERDDSLERPTHVFVQAGVGCLCASAAYHFHGEDSPVLICVEPVSADCYFASVQNEGKLTQSEGKLDSIMNGLNCGLPSYAAFPWVMNGYSFMMTLESDEDVKQEMRYLYRGGAPEDAEKHVRIVGGESGVAGLVALEKCMENEDWRTQVGLDENSVVMVVISEGDTDEDLYRGIIEEGGAD